MELILGSGQPEIQQWEQGSHLYRWIMENVVVITKVIFWQSINNLEQGFSTLALLTF